MFVMSQAVRVAVLDRAVAVRVLVDEVDRAAGARGRRGRRAGVPSPTMRWSSENTTQRSASRRAVSRSWVASTIVLPAAFSSTMSSISHCWVRGSSAAVGSSNSSTSGFITSTEAIATRFFWPPESWYGRAVGELGDVEHREHVVDALRRPRRGSSPVAAGRTRSPRAPSARTPARRSSGTRSRPGRGSPRRTARPRGCPR